MQGRAFGDDMREIVGFLGETPKVGKGRDVGIAGHVHVCIMYRYLPVLLLGIRAQPCCWLNLGACSSMGPLGLVTPAHSVP